MSVQGLFSIGGIASGLDTENMIKQLMQLERQPMKRIEQRQDELRQVDEAWGKVTTKLSALRTATDGISRLDRFDEMVKVTSSNTDAVSVESTGTTDTGSQSFTIDQLATTQQSHAGDVFAGLDAQIGDRTLEITVDGTTHNLTDGLAADATLDDLVTAINDAGIGVRASTVQVESGQYQLLMESEQTGVDNSFDLAGTNWDTPFTTTQAAANAKLTVGGVTVERSSNTIDDLVEGASLTLHQVTDQAVTVTAERDVDGAVEAVEGYVDAINGVLSTLSELTAYDPDTGKAGPLQGEAAASSLAMSLRNAVSAQVTGLDGMASLASSVGITTTRDGILSFDEAAARQAFTDDFDAAARTLARSGSTTDPAVAYVNGTSSTQPGTYEVQVTQAAAIARVTGSTYAPPSAEPKVFRIARPGSDPVSVTIPEGTTLASAVTKINEALREAGVTTITASEQELADGTMAIDLAEERYGSAHGFTVEEVDAATGEVIAGGQVFGLEGEHYGTDVAGTIDGEAATGRGRLLTAVAGPADGLSVQVDGLPADPVQVTYSRGVVGQVGQELARAEGITGTVSRARSSIESQIDIYQTRLEGFEQRLETRESTLRRQFNAMESALHRLNSQGDWLQGQLANLSGPQR